ncbi:MAG: hypothetical protein WBP94_15685 [Rhodomicrobiaceae bacterium]
MRAIAKSCGAALTLCLAACGHSADLPQVGLLGGPDQANQETAQATEGVEVANAPPLPVRNGRIKRGEPVKVAAATNQGATKSAGLSLPTLSAGNLFTTSAYASDTSQWDEPPVDVYTQLAQQIRACWFTPGASKLTNYGFLAQVEPGETQDATIIIYEKATDGGRGLQAFRIGISAGLAGSTVKAENRKLDAKLDTEFKSDLVRWSQGNQNCQG